MAGAQRDVAHVAGAELDSLRQAAGGEHRHAGAAGNVVLPFVGVGVPVQPAQGAKLERQQRPGHGRRDGGFLGGDDAHGAAAIGTGLLGLQTVAVRQRAGLLRAGGRVGRERRRPQPLGDADLLLRQRGEEEPQVGQRTSRGGAYPPAGRSHFLHPFQPSISTPPRDRVVACQDRVAPGSSRQPTGNRDGMGDAVASTARVALSALAVACSRTSPRAVRQRSRSAAPAISCCTRVCVSTGTITRGWLTRVADASTRPTALPFIPRPNMRAVRWPGSARSRRAIPQPAVKAVTHRPATTPSATSRKPRSGLVRTCGRAAEALAYVNTRKLTEPTSFTSGRAGATRASPSIPFPATPRTDGRRTATVRNASALWVPSSCRTAAWSPWASRPTAWKTTGVVRGLRRVDSSTRPRLKARLPLACCDHSVEVAATGMEAIRARPTSRLPVCSTLGQPRITWEMPTRNATGSARLATSPANNGLGSRSRWRSWAVCTPSPALNSRNASSSMGSDSGAFSPHRETAPNETPRSHRPGPGTQAAAAQVASRNQKNCSWIKRPRNVIAWLGLGRVHARMGFLPKLGGAGKFGVWAARNGPGSAVPLSDGAGAELAGIVSVVMHHLVSAQGPHEPGTCRECQRMKRVQNAVLLLSDRGG